MKIEEGKILFHNSNIKIANIKIILSFIRPFARAYERYLPQYEPTNDPFILIYTENVAYIFPDAIVLSSQPYILRSIMLVQEIYRYFKKILCLNVECILCFEHLVFGSTVIFLANN